MICIGICDTLPSHINIADDPAGVLLQITKGNQLGLVIGMDEAGYGPNLGPLVISATVWRVTGDPRHTDFWQSLGSVVSQTPVKTSERIHVADSKEVYSPAKGLQPLEQSIQTIFGLTSQNSNSFRSLCDWLVTSNSVSTSSGVPEQLCRPSANGDFVTSTIDSDSTRCFEPSFLDVEPWFHDVDLLLPTTCQPSDLEESRSRLKTACGSAGIQLVKIASDVVLTERFNSVSNYYSSKGAALSRFTLGLLRSVWDPDSNEPTLIIGDKHGGRSRYDELIDEQLDGQMIFRLQEGRQKSSYRVGESEINFQTRAEEYFPVAVASMVCKYVREQSMRLFNDFWRRLIPDIKPTKGYPVDARRFRNEITDTQKQLGIPDTTLWRER